MVMKSLLKRFFKLFHRHDWKVTTTIMTDKNEYYTLPNPIRTCLICSKRQSLLHGKWQ
jgi:hypothetical protein